jgi:hypothetical protein
MKKTKKFCFTKKNKTHNIHRNLKLQTKKNIQSGGLIIDSRNPITRHSEYLIKKNTYTSQIGTIGATKKLLTNKLSRYMNNYRITQPIVNTNSIDLKIKKINQKLRKEIIKNMKKIQSEPYAIELPILIKYVEILKIILDNITTIYKINININSIILEISYFIKKIKYIKHIYMQSKLSQINESLLELLHQIAILNQQDTELINKINYFESIKDFINLDLLKDFIKFLIDYIPIGNENIDRLLNSSLELNKIQITNNIPYGELLSKINGLFTTNFNKIHIINFNTVEQKYQLAKVLGVSEVSEEAGVSRISRVSEEPGVSEVSEVAGVSEEAAVSRISRVSGVSEE